MIAIRMGKIKELILFYLRQQCVSYTVIYLNKNQLLTYAEGMWPLYEALAKILQHLKRGRKSRPRKAPKFSGEA